MLSERLLDTPVYLFSVTIPRNWKADNVGSFVVSLEIACFNGMLRMYRRASDSTDPLVGVSS